METLTVGNVAQIDDTLSAISIDLLADQTGFELAVQF